MPAFPARPGSVRIGPDQCQYLPPRVKGRLMRRITDLCDPDLTAIGHFLLYGWVWQNGVCDPALSTISAKTGVRMTTLKAKMKTLYREGILARINRGMAIGRRFAQWTNAYLFNVLDEDRCEAAGRPPQNNLDSKSRLRGKAWPVNASPHPAGRLAEPPGSLLARTIAEIEARKRAREEAGNGRS